MFSSWESWPGSRQISHWAPAAGRRRSRTAHAASQQCDPASGQFSQPNPDHDLATVTRPWAVQLPRSFWHAFGFKPAGQVYGHRPARFR